MNRFLPAVFDLYEFGDRPGAGSRPAPGRRWFSHGNGLLGAPAEEVSLGWSDGGATIVVCTSGRSYDEGWARSRAAHLALGGDELPIPDRPGPPAEVSGETDRTGSAAALWGEAPALLSGRPAARAAACDGFAAGYRRLTNGMIFIAAVGIDPHRFAVRPARPKVGRPPGRRQGLRVARGASRVMRESELPAGPAGATCRWG